jgi:hypothetical protein
LTTAKLARAGGELGDEPRFRDAWEALQLLPDRSGPQPNLAEVLVEVACGAVALRRWTPHLPASGGPAAILPHPEESFLRLTAEILEGLRAQPAE